MHHTIPIDQLGQQGRVMADAVSACVHCGFCLAACPTYQVLGEEMDSPRGRILLMKSVLEGQLDLQQTAAYIDRCLGCLGCLAACPSGVAYGDLLATYRSWAEPQRKRPPAGRLSGQLAAQTLPHPGRFRLAAATGKLAKPLQGLLPQSLAAMLDLLPDEIPAAPPLPAIYPAQGQRRARVALLAGCVQQVIAPAINWATLRVLAANGIETVIPAGQGCCGALALHTGESQQARDLARVNLRVFAPGEVDAIITNAAGCGSGIKEYELLFAGQPEAKAAQAYAAKTQDISQFLHNLGLRPPPPLPQPLRLAYHHACHLAHAQGVRDAPRRLLAQIPNLTLVDFPESDLCCGSAGTYNIEQPEIAGQLGERKARQILSTAPDAVALGNIGCLVQIERHLAALGQQLPVYHTVQVLDMAYGGATPAAG